MKTLSRRRITVAASILAVAALAGTPALAKDGSPQLGAAKMSHGAMMMSDKMKASDGAMMSDDKMMSDKMMKSGDDMIAPGKARYSKR